MLRLGIIGDVHTEASALQHAIEYLKAARVDAILCTGDVADGEGDADDVERCCELLAQHGVLTVCGNHDRWLQAHEMRDLDDASDPDDLDSAVLEGLAQLPATAELPTPLGMLLLCHGMGSDDMAGVQPFDHGQALSKNAALQQLIAEGRYAIVVAGHTHRRMVRHVGGIVLINAGTLHRRHNPCFGIIDFDASRVEFIACTRDDAPAEVEYASLTANVG